MEGAIGGVIMLVYLAFVLAIYLFFCYCMKLIVEKTGQEAGVMIWIPLLQIFPMLRAAGMNPLFFIAFFIPIVNILVGIYMWVQISINRGKGALFGILMIVPVINIFAFLYLAFSD